MNLSINLKDILFLDIETVPKHESWEELLEEEQQLFEKKTAYQRKEDYTAEEFYDRAGIWAEFGKIVCISVAYFAPNEKTYRLRVTSFAGENEKDILFQFKELLINHFSKKQHLLCAHNGKEFDFPYIARRMIIHQIELPTKLNLFGKKPWDVAHIDTMELWKFGDYKHYTSMSLLCHIFNVPTPKDDITGADVARVYYEENDLERIVVYCQKDVIALIQLFLRFRNEALVEEDYINQ